MPPIINKTTGISIGLVALVITPIIALVIVVAEMRSEQADMREDQADMHREMLNQWHETYSISQASEDALREAMANPGHKVPDPRHPGQLLVVELPATID